MPCPQDLFGRVPILIVTRAPRATSACFSTVVPFAAAPSTSTDWMYFASAEAPGAASTKSFPFSRWIVTLWNTGLPSWYSGSPGVTG